ncbi:MAG: FIG019733: possible DNA-binding protein [uncultured Frankineae bacterium]|uniref:FIG019733: possible DNA-binding protein n=1 Tax=uncultured Frankineae bacterium TaxID=437475 RepID=A0A6J4KD57_9ACTN|nr:MAG: FIG019733: possible DNA-binding protein [uncultured Frankineae bacterium]
MTAAPGGTADQLPRLLALVPYLLARPGVRLAEVAATFGVTEDRLRKDLNLLWVCGLPGHGPGDLIDVEFEGDTITLTEPAGVTRPLRLTVDEALALVVALRALAETPGLVERDAVDRALAKVEQAAGAAAGPAHRVEVSVEGEDRVLPVVRTALAERRRLHLSYYVPGRDETTERDVDPVRLLLVQGRSYLEAWCRRAEGVRLFRLDRVADLQVLDAPAEPPVDLEPRELSEGLFRPSPDDLLVTLALRPGAAWVADYHPCESVVEQDDGGLVVTLRARDTSWVRRLVLRLGEQGQVLAPRELADAVRADARAALRAYEG